MEKSCENCLNFNICENIHDGCVFNYDCWLPTYQSLLAERDELVKALEDARQSCERFLPDIAIMYIDETLAKIQGASK